MLNKYQLRRIGTAALFLQAGVALQAQSVESLEAKISQLEQNLAQTQSELATAQNTLANAADTGPSKITLGDFTIGGCIRANYAIGDYASGEGPTRGSNGGDMSLDVFRINVDYAKDAITGKFEYRWYHSYNMLHTAWIGYQEENDYSVQVGVNRVPFGPGAYGVSNSWFFDQHYYVGLADDMDLGIKYTKQLGDWTLDLAYYFSDEGNWRGSSRDSARYSYDPVVGENGVGYNEQNQVNMRLIGTISDTTEVGMSLQAGQLDGENVDDGEAYAASIHMKNSFGSFGIKSQLTYYNYNVDAAATGDDELILFGAFDYADSIATEAFIPAIAVNYFIETDTIDWLDSVNVYAEYSSIMKTGETASGEDFKDSDLAVIGAAWARGGWYIYTDLAFSNGNYFVGLDKYTTQGANLDATWQTRLNINFGYYF